MPSTVRAFFIPKRRAPSVIFSPKGSASIFPKGDSRLKNIILTLIRRTGTRAIFLELNRSKRTENITIEACTAMFGANKSVKRKINPAVIRKIGVLKKFVFLEVFVVKTGFVTGIFIEPFFIPTYQRDSFAK